MWRVGLLVVVLGCGGGERPAGGDAAIDAKAGPLPPPRNDPGPAPFPGPFEATFVTPAGVLETHYLFAQAVGGDCDPPFWELTFSASELGAEPIVKLHVSLPRYTGVEVTGTRPASAYYQSSEPLVSHGTQSATFAATRLDYPGTGAPRITGRFLVTDPAWTLDLELDALAIATGCI
jgi:hypothetical protein